MIKLAFLDVNICLIVLVISMNVLVLHPCLPDSGGTQAFGHDTISFYTISSHRLYAAVFNMESMYWSMLDAFCV